MCVCVCVCVRVTSVCLTHSPAVLFRKRAGLRACQHWAVLRHYVRVLGALGGLRKYKGHTTRAERLVQLDWAARAEREGQSTALYHLPPCCCLRAGAWFGGKNLEDGAEFLHTCKVALSACLALLLSVSSSVSLASRSL